jgi:hypothetical protein
VIRNNCITIEDKYRENSLSETYDTCNFFYIDLLNQVKEALSEINKDEKKTNKD